MATQPKPKPKPKPEPDPEPEPEEEDQAAELEAAGKEAYSGMRETKPLRQQTFGERAVGLSFNPSGDATVNELKSLYAAIVDICHAKRQSLMAGSETHRLWTVAITEAQGAQMWAVKAATFKE